MSLIAAGLIALGSQAQAATYHFGQLTNGSDPAPSPVHFADLTIEDSNADGNWEFTLTALGLNSIFGLDSFIGGLYVVEGTGIGSQPSGVSGVTGDASVNLDTTNVGGGGLHYDYSFNFGTPGPTLQQTRLTDSETVSWIADGMGVFAPFADGQLALKMQGINLDQYPDTNSAWYISPVPEPETYAMLLIGLGMVAFSLRNKQSMSRES